MYFEYILELEVLIKTKFCRNQQWIVFLLGNSMVIKLILFKRKLIKIIIEII